MDRERMDTWCERGLLGLVVVTLVFAVLAIGGVRTTDFLVIQGLAALMALLWTVRLWISPSPKLLWPPVVWIVLAFVGYVAWRYHTAPLEYVAREEFVRVVVYAIVFLITVNNVQRSESMLAIVAVLLGTATLVALYGGYQFITGSPNVWHFVRPDQYAHRGSGSFVSPNHMGGFLELILPLGLGLLILGRIGHVARILTGYATLACFVGIVVSLSRGAWIASAASLLLFFLVLLRRRDYWIPAIVALAILAAAWVAFVNRVQFSRSRFAEITASGSVENIRFLLWKPAIRIWQENVWFGAGPAHFDYRFRKFRPPKVQMRPYRVHNDYLNTLADLGIVGLALVLGAVAAIFWGVVRAWRFSQRGSDLGSRRSTRSALLLGGSVSLTAMLAHSIVDFNMHIPANALVTLVIMAMLTVHWRFATERFWVAAGLCTRAALSVLLLAGAGYLCDRGLLRAREWVSLQAAAEAESAATSLTRRLEAVAEKPDEAARLRSRIAAANQRLVEALHRALAIEPNNFETVYRIGETLRIESWSGLPGFQKTAREAMEWFDRAAAMNPFDPYPHLRRGMCLDWIGETPQATEAFDKALELDPNGYYTVAHLGWHAMYLDDYPRAQQLFLRSLKLKEPDHPDDNPIAARYLAIVERRMHERALRERENSPQKP